MIEEYVEDRTLRIEWRGFPYLGPESTTAAHAGRAAAAQDKFWEFHDAMYADQLPPDSGGMDEDHLSGVAEDLGLDVEQFLADMNSEATQRAVQDDFVEGQAIGVTGTPAFIINGGRWLRGRTLTPQSRHGCSHWSSPSSRPVSRGDAGRAAERATRTLPRSRRSTPAMIRGRRSAGSITASTDPHATRPGDEMPGQLLVVLGPRCLP